MGVQCQLTLETAGVKMRFSICGHFLVSRICDAGWTESRFKCARLYTHQIPQKVLLYEDTRTVAMEVGIC